MSKKVLVVEDDHQLRAMLIEFLTLSGFDVFNAENGVEGLAIAEEERPDVIISDIIMPNTDGIGLMLSLENKGLLEGVKIIAMSGGGPWIDMHEALAFSKYHGADKVLQKPFELDELLLAINEL